MPAALGGRLLLGTPGHECLPVHGVHVDLEPRLLHEGLGDGRQVGQDGEVRGVHQHEGRAVVASLSQKLAGLGEIGPQEILHTCGGLQWAAAGIEGLADLVVRRLTDHGLEEVLLVEGIEDSLADLGIVERLVQRVKAERVLVSQGVDVDELDVGVFLQHGQEVV